MKMKALAQICAEARTLNLMDAVDGSQWAGTSTAWWKLPDNLGRVNTASLCAMMDFDEGKQSKLNIEHMDMPDVFDTEDDAAMGEEALLFWLGRRLRLDAVDMLPCKAPNGEVFCIPFDKLKPGRDAEQLSLTLRETGDGAPYIAVKDGMFLTGIIVPGKIEPELMTWLGDVMAGLTVT